MAEFDKYMVIILTRLADLIRDEILPVGDASVVETLNTRHRSIIYINFEEL